MREAWNFSLTFKKIEEDQNKSINYVTALEWVGVKDFHFNAKTIVLKTAMLAEQVSKIVNICVTSFMNDS